MHGSVVAEALVDGSLTPGMIEEKSDEDFFRLDIAEPMNLVIEAWTFDLYDGNEKGLPREDLDVEVLDRRGVITPVNVRVYFFGFEIADEFDAGTYYIRVSTPNYIESHPVPYAIHAFEDTGYTEFLEDCEAESRSLDDFQTNDPLYGCQWHLNNREGEDINIEAVWTEGVTGSGINVAVVDDGMDYLHEDLKANVDKARNHDYTGKGDIYHPYWHHGTNVAGIISAPDNNGTGVRGVAPRTTVYGYNFLVEPTDMNEADAMARNRDVTAVSNNSWGPLDGPAFDFATRIWEVAVDGGIREGYGGKGVFYAWAAGNGHLEGDEANLDEYANYYGVTAICAVDDDDTKSSYSETGANLWVCAPSSGGSRGIVTTENSDRYYAHFGGTSAATPIVAGVAALMREANPDLTWRDLKLILAASARKNDLSNPGWEVGAHKYGAESNTDRYYFNHEYGFGMVDANAAVDLARGWVSPPPFESSAVESEELNLHVPDAPASGDSTTAESTLLVNTSIGFLEFVEINVTLNHDSFRDLGIELVSPTGTVSRLVGPFDTLNDDPYIDFVPVQGKLRFGSARHLGEDPNGEWKLRITDHIPSKSGELTSWSVTFYGHESTPHPPIVDWITTGDESLTVGWLSPGRTGGSPVTAFDLRYSLASGDETVDSLWTVVEDAWTAQLGGKLEYTITGLVGEARYDVQVRAVNMVGEGHWSGELTATASASPCVTDGAVADAHNNPGLVSDCRTLLEAQEGFDVKGTLNWGTGTLIPNWEGITVGGTPNRVTKIALGKEGLAGTFPAQLGDLTRLKSLDLFQNMLTGEIPTQIGKLINLTELNLEHNALSGTLPAQLGDLAILTELNLSHNQLSGGIPVELGRLSNLTHLSLNGNELSGEIPAWLGSLADLRSVFLSGNSFTGCIPEELRAIAVHDLDQLGILFCGRDILVALYGATGGSNWKVNTNWLSGKPISEWYGVTANYRGRVTTLYLRANQLAGEIPTELGSLSNLNTLYLSSNQLTGKIPTELGDLSELETLALSYNQLTGEIPKELGNLSRLQSLVLYVNQLTGQIPTELGFLSNLETLGLSSNQLTGCIPEALRNVPSNDLEGLRLPFCLASSPEAPTIITTTPGIESLTITWSPPSNDGHSVITAYDLRYVETATDQTEDSNWTVVKDVWTTGNGVLEYTLTELSSGTKYDLQVRAVNAAGSGPWSATATGTTTMLSACITGGAVADSTNTGLVSDCEALLVARDNLAGSGATRSLNWASDTPLLQWYGVVLSGTPERVTQLRLHGQNGNPERGLSEAKLNGTIPPELGRLSELQVLYLHRNNLTGEVPGTLNSLSKLRLLYLYDNGLTGISDELGPGMTELRRLFAQRNDLTGEIPSGLGSMTNLDWLTLYSNQLTGEIPAELGGLTRLKRLYVHENGLTGEIPRELAGVSSLTHLLLHRNALTGKVSSELGGLTNLEWLSLYDNKLDGSIPSALGDLSSLEVLYFHGNDLKGPVPSELENLTALTNLWLKDNMLSGQLPEVLNNLTNLERVRISGNDFTGCIPAGLTDDEETGRTSDAESLGLEVCEDS